MAHLLFLLSSMSCVLWEDSPYSENVARLTDADADGFSVGEGDCNDADPDVFPGATDNCDGTDNDCDGSTDKDLPDTVWCADLDGDGFGDIETQVRTCFPEGGWVQDCTDCDDNARAINPSAVESCNGLDDDCDGDSDPADAAGASEWHADRDGDGYGASELLAVGCEAPPGTLADNSDCDDLQADTHPGASEICNDGRDNDCDGTLNGCGWEGDQKLDTSYASHIGGAEADHEGLGIALSIADVTGDGVPDLAFAGFGAMYGDDSMGDVHTWYGTPAGDRSVHEADGHAYGVPDAYVGVTEWGAPVRPRDLDSDGVDELIVAGGGWSVDYGTQGVLFALPTPLYGEVQIPVEAVWASGRAEREGFGAGFTLSRSIGPSSDNLVVAAPENSERGAYGGAIYIADVASPNAAAATARVVGEEGDRLGLDVSADVDVNGDGVDDLVLASAPRSPPTVFLFHGPLAGELLEADAEAELVDAAYGAEGVFVVPDLDADGCMDIAVQSFRELNLLSGTTMGPTDIETARIAHLESSRDAQTSIGMSVAGGDLGRDGEQDLVVGLPEADTPSKFGGLEAAGAIVVVPYSSIQAGANDAWEVARATFYGTAEQGFFGARLALGDVNADGHLDLFASAATASESGYRANGSLWFILGGGI